MIEKCSLGNMNNNMKIIGLILLFCILFIVIIYYFRSTFKKHNDIMERFDTIKATIDQTGGTLNPDGEGNNDIYNGEISMRKCQVYFVGNSEQSVCDTNYNEDPLSTNCKYEFKDGWNEIDTIKNNNNNTITVPKKIYNKQYTNIGNIENSKYMTACYKDRDTNGNTKYLYDMRDNVVIYGNGGSVNDETDKNTTLRLNVKDGNNDPMIKSYISKHFGKTGNTTNDNLNMISSICSIGYNNVVPDNLKNFYKFNLEKNGNGWVLQNIKDVVLNKTQTEFEGNTPSNFTGSSAYGMYIDELKQLRDGKVRFTVFKSTSIPNKPVKIYKFKYNYLCSGKVLEYNSPINDTILMDNLISNTGNETSSFTFDVSYNSDIIKHDFWTTSVANVDMKDVFINKLREALDNSKIPMDEDQTYTTLTSQINEIGVLIGGVDGIEGTGGANGIKNKFHELITIGEESGKKQIIELTNNKNEKIFNFDKGYKIFVEEINSNEFIGKTTNDPIALRKIYFPSTPSPSTNIPLYEWKDNDFTVKIKSSDSSFNSVVSLHKLFNNNIIGNVNCFHSLQVYNNSSNVYNGTTTFRGNKGIVLYIDLGRSIIPTSMMLSPRDNSDATSSNFLTGVPGNFKIYASDTLSDWINTDSNTWVLIHQQDTNLNYKYREYTKFDLNNISSQKKQYRYYAMVTTKLTGNYGYLMIGKWAINGEEIIKPIKINDNYSYIQFSNNISDLLYDFTQYNTLQEWKKYASSIPNATTQLTDYITKYRGISDDVVWSGYEVEGFLQIILPNTHNYLEITWGNNYSTGSSKLLLNGIVLETLTGFSKKTSKYNYTGTSILKVVEGFSLLLADIIIKLSNIQEPYTINFMENTVCDILVVGGGGAGGNSMGGGGGSGGVVYTVEQIMNGTYNVGVGKGGLGILLNTDGQGTVGVDQDGSDSFIRNAGNTNDISLNMGGTSQNLRGFGGGAGGVYYDTSFVNGRNGGSGGGTSEGNNDTAYTTGTSIQPNTFWNGNSYIKGGSNGNKNVTGDGLYIAGGGGGLGGVSNSYVDGKSGLPINITGTSQNYAGGGGGGQYAVNLSLVSSSTNRGFGGSSIGGVGRIYNNVNRVYLREATSGTNGTGSGGGGGAYAQNPDNSAGSGGSGVVIIRFRSSISVEELKKRSKDAIDNNSVLTNNKYLGDKKYFTIDINDKYPSIKTEPYNLRKIIVTSMIFLEKSSYNLNINLGIDNINKTIFHEKKFEIMGINTINIDENGIYNFTIVQGGFYKFSYIAVVLFKEETTITFNISNTTGFNFRNYLYGGSLLYKNIAYVNGIFNSVLYNNNTQESLSSIVNYMNSPVHDYWGINKMNDDRDKKILEREDRNTVLLQNNKDSDEAYDSVIKSITNGNFSGIHDGNNRWFNTASPTLKTNVSPSLIFENYNDVNYITYEKKEGTTNTTPSIQGNVGADFRTNFQTNNTINTATIYVLRQ
jgi:hypothetical protein